MQFTSQNPASCKELQILIRENRRQLDSLGEGGMGVVCCSRNDLPTEKHLNFLPTEGQIVLRLKRENTSGLVAFVNLGL